MRVDIRALDRKITGFGRDMTVLIMVVCSNSYFLKLMVNV